MSKSKKHVVCLVRRRKGIVEYKFNIADVNTVFRKFNFWRNHELVALTTARATEDKVSCSSQALE